MPKKFNIKFVFSQMPLTVVYFFIGSSLGTISSFLLFFLNRDFLVFLLEIWFRRLKIGLEVLGGHQTLWFIVNNIVALMIIVFASVLIFSFVLRKKKAPKYFKRFNNLERHNPKITLYSAYMIPIGALVINGFLVSLFLTYALFNYGVESAASALILMVPHGVNELVALFLACSLGLAYLKIISPMIKKRQIDKSIKVGKSLLFSNTTLIFIVLIAILVVFSGFVEGILGQFVA
jgi:hypothetical protein